MSRLSRSEHKSYESGRKFTFYSSVSSEGVTMAQAIWSLERPGEVLSATAGRAKDWNGSKERSHYEPFDSVTVRYSRFGKTADLGQHVMEFDAKRKRWVITLAWGKSVVGATHLAALAHLLDAYLESEPVTTSQEV